MSAITDQIAALRRNRERYVASIVNLDAKLSAEEAKPVTTDPEEPVRVSRVREYVAKEKERLTAAIVAIDDDLALLK